MADRVEHFTVTAPAGTLSSAPIEVAVRFDPGEVERFDIVVPDGHAGLTGIALALAHQPIVPKGNGKFFIANAETIQLPMAELPNSGAWSVFIYNVDHYDHTFYLRVLVREIGRGPLTLEPGLPGPGVSDGGGGVPEPEPGPSPEPEPEPEPPPPDEEPPPEEPPPDEEPPPVDEEPPPDEPVDTEPPPEEPPPEPEPAPPPEPPPPPAPIIPTYPLPGDYVGLETLASRPGNLGMLIGSVIGVKILSSGSNLNGTYWTMRFFSDLGNTYDWNYYLSGAKAGQWVGPFNLRTGVPGG